MTVIYIECTFEFIDDLLALTPDIDCMFYSWIHNRFVNCGSFNFLSGPSYFALKSKDRFDECFNDKLVTILVNRFHNFDDTMSFKFTLFHDRTLEGFKWMKMKPVPVWN